MKKINFEFKVVILYFIAGMALLQGLFVADVSGCPGEPVCPPCGCDGCGKCGICESDGCHPKTCGNCEQCDEQTGDCVYECIPPCTECNGEHCINTCPEGMSGCYYGDGQCTCYDYSGCLRCDPDIGPRAIEVISVNCGMYRCPNCFICGAETWPTYYREAIEWSWTGGGFGEPLDPDIWGPGLIMIFFDSCGSQTVTGRLGDCASNQTQVDVCCEDEDCCDGQCYDTTTQKCCSDTLWGSVYLCGINETCCKGQCCSEDQACCNTSFTGGTCYNTTTQKCCPGVSGGYDFICDIDEKCCDDSSCAAPCEEVGSETLCSSENNKSCPTCVGISGSCSGSKARHYTDETIYNCSGGCPGDCDYEDPAPTCYDTYFCADYIYYKFAKCTIWRYEPGDIPQDPEPLECYSRDYVWGCTRCQQGSFDGHWPVASKTCH